jgi:primary-amine oxidase
MNLRIFTVFYVVCLTVFAQTSIARPNDINCPAGHTINKVFSSGAEWSLCWEEKANEGIVLSNILYSTPGNNPRKVLGEASLSQIQTDFDDGSTQQFSVTSVGLGGDSLVDLSSQDCPQGRLVENNGKSVLCETTKPMGYIWKYRTQHKQGDLLELFSLSKINSISYVIKWKFYENGIIEPAVGVSGKLTKIGSNLDHGWRVTENDLIAVGFTNHYFWRLDFDIDVDGNNDLLEQISSIPSSNKLKKSKVIASINTESALSLNPVNKVFWRVRDNSEQNSTVGHISYELNLLNYAHQGKGNNSEPWLNNDFFVTHYDPCERFAVKNPTQDGCAENISQFVNGQNINAKDIVTWYRASYHHLPRDEDINQIATRWTSLKLIPRDWSPSNPL